MPSSCPKNLPSEKASAAESALTTYVVLAYRRGWANAHHYLVGAAPCLEQATRLAREACDDRGGKYGVGVYQLSDRATPQVLAAYFPSIHGERAAYANPQIEVFQRLGQKVVQALDCKKVLLPTAQGTTLEPVAVSVPPWLAAEKKRIQEFEWAMAAPQVASGEPTADSSD